SYRLSHPPATPRPTPVPLRCRALRGLPRPPAAGRGRLRTRGIRVAPRGRAVRRSATHELRNSPPAPSAQSRGSGTPARVPDPPGGGGIADVYPPSDSYVLPESQAGLRLRRSTPPGGSDRRRRRSRESTCLST